MAHYFTLFVDGCAQVKLPKWEVPTSVAAGKSHSLALTVYGELYAWGKGWCGELGVAPNDPVVKMPMKASAALTAGSSPSLPSASGGGSSSRNTLGKSGGSDEPRATMAVVREPPRMVRVAPRKVTSKAMFLRVAAGDCHTCALALKVRAVLARVGRQGPRESCSVQTSRSQHRPYTRTAIERMPADKPITHLGMPLYEVWRRHLSLTQ